MKDHSDKERGNPLLPLYGLFFPISRKGSYICTRQDSTYDDLCETLAGTRNSSMGPP